MAPLLLRWCGLGTPLPLVPIPLIVFNHSFRERARVRPFTPLGMRKGFYIAPPPLTLNIVIRMYLTFFSSYSPSFNGEPIVYGLFTQTQLFFQLLFLRPGRKRILLER